MIKSYFARQALRKLGIRADEFSVDNDELRDGLCELENMMANWDGRGLRFSYQFASDPENVDPHSESNVPDWTHDAIIWQLAMRLAPDYGKASDNLRAQASASLNTLYMSLDVPEIQYERNMPIGSGNNHRFNQYYRYYRPASEIVVENAHALITNNGRAFVSGGQETTTTGGGTPSVPTTPGVPDTPIGLAAVVAGVDAAATVTLTWNTVSDAVGYVLRRDGNAVFTSITPTSIQYVDTPGAAGSYSYTITAYNQFGESAQSSPVVAVVPSSFAPSTFDATQTSSSFTLSNGNLTLTAPGGTVSISALLNTPRSSGKYYFEVTHGSNDFEVGFVTEDTVGSPVLDSTLTASSVNYAPTLNFVHLLTQVNRRFSSGTSVESQTYGSALSAGDRMNIAVDFDTGNLWIGRNGTWFDSGDPAAGTNPAPLTLPSGAVRFGVAKFSGSSPPTLTANFGQSAFADTVPTGFTSGI
jgi:hypothetical protein